MGRYYFRAADFIREERFEVLAPAYYHPHKNANDLTQKPQPRQPINRHRFVDISRVNPEPFYKPLDPHQMERSSYTVAIMLDMFQKNVVFEIVNPIDIVKIFDGLDRYLLSLKIDVEQGVELSTEWAKLVLKWRKEVYKHYYRYMQLNPAALEELYPNNNPDTNIFSLMSAIGGTSYDDLKRDPLRARSKPPYEIEKIAPKDEVDKVGGDFDMESSLGLSKYQPPKEEGGSKFDFDSFLNPRR